MISWSSASRNSFKIAASSSAIRMVFPHPFLWVLLPLGPTPAHLYRFAHLYIGAPHLPQNGFSSAPDGLPPPHPGPRRRALSAWLAARNSDAVTMPGTVM